MAVTNTSKLSNVIGGLALGPWKPNNSETRGMTREYHLSSRGNVEGIRHPTQFLKLC